MSVKKDQHVVRSSNGGWAVRSTGAEKASKVFGTKELAVSHARTVARNSSTGMYIHGEDGRVLSKYSYDGTRTVEKHSSGSVIHQSIKGKK
jgi:hypothetical protein